MSDVLPTWLSPSKATLMIVALGVPSTLADRLFGWRSAIPRSFTETRFLRRSSRKHNKSSQVKSSQVQSTR
jgi:hypothetical protein